MVQPRIAVAIPTYARKDMLLRLIDSLPREWMIFVSDNAASLAPLAAPLGPHVTVSHSETLIPMFANWNRALSLVDDSCTHVFIPSDDDLFLPAAGPAVAEALARHPDADMVVFGCDLFNEHDQRWAGYAPPAHEALPPGDGFLRFIAGVDARMPGVLFRKAFLDRIGAFDERFELTAADSELIQRAALLGRTVFVPTVIGLYRIWSGSLTHARQATDLWMQEIGLWTDKIGGLLRSGHQPASRHVDIGRYRAEILALNLLAGLNNLRAKGAVAEARAFLSRHPVPAGARLKTRLRLLRCRMALRSAAA
jgi:hypothetical protein